MSTLIISNKLTNQEAGIFGYQLKNVLSGSMEPTIQTGSIIAIEVLDQKERKKLQKGDVITFLNKDNQLITHRIEKVKNANNHVAFVTKGDNNDTADLEPILSSNVVGKYGGFTIPYLGYLIHYAQTPNGILLLTIFPGISLLAYSAFSIWRTLKNLDNHPKDSIEEK